MKLRQLFQFRLRTLLLLMVPVAALLSVLGRHMYEARRQKAVVAALRADGFEVGFSDDVPNLPEWLDTGYLLRVSELKFKDSDRGVSDLSVLAELANLETLYLYKTPLNDLSSLADLKNLRTLVLLGPRVSDLSPIAELKTLRELYLIGTQVSDLSPVAELQNMERFRLRNMPVSDLSPLAELENLHELYLISSPVSDLSPLSELTNLRTLFLLDTHVMDVSTLARLKDLKITSDHNRGSVGCYAPSRELVK